MKFFLGNEYRHSHLSALLLMIFVLFVLVPNSTSGKSIQVWGAGNLQVPGTTLRSSDTVCPDDFPIGFSLVCLFDSPKTEVKFFVENSLERTEALPPYAIAGDLNGFVSAWDRFRSFGGANVTVACLANDGDTLSVNLLFMCDNKANKKSDCSSVSLPTVTTAPDQNLRTTGAISAKAEEIAYFVDAGSAEEDPSLIYGLPTLIYAVSSLVNIADTATPTLFRTQRHGVDFGYKFPGLTPVQEYSVSIGFSEIMTANCVAGRRVFDVSIQDTLVESNVDIFSEVGCLTALTLEYTAVADSNGYISVSLVGSVGAALVSNIQISRRDQGSSSTVSSSPVSFHWISNPNLLPTSAERHESCFVMHKNMAYLIGGRGSKSINVLHPNTLVWQTKPQPPAKFGEIHHMQCVSFGEYIYIIGSWTGTYPAEQARSDILLYNPESDNWSTRAFLPNNPERRRGSAAVAVYGAKIIVGMGNIGGHNRDATVVGFLDEYDPVADVWNSNFPDAPHPRDHTGGGMIGNKFCVGGGRDSGADIGDFRDAFILETDCYDFSTGQWETGLPNIPSGQAGCAVGVTCDGKLMVVGGENSSDAVADVRLFDGSSWEIGPSLLQKRHGTGIAVESCDSDSPRMFIASGAGGLGDKDEQLTSEVYTGVVASP